MSAEELKKIPLNKAFPEVTVDKEVYPYDSMRRHIVSVVKEKYGSSKSFAESYSSSFGVSASSIRSVLSEGGPKSFALISQIANFLGIDAEEKNINITYFR